MRKENQGGSISGPLTFEAPPKCLRHACHPLLHYSLHTHEDDDEADDDDSSNCQQTHLTNAPPPLKIRLGVIEWPLKVVACKMKFLPVNTVVPNTTIVSMLFPVAAMSRKHFQEIGLSGGERINSQTAITTPTKLMETHTYLIDGAGLLLCGKQLCLLALFRTRLECRF